MPVAEVHALHRLGVTFLQLTEPPALEPSPQRGLRFLALDCPFDLPTPSFPFTLLRFLELQRKLLGALASSKETHNCICSLVSILDVDECAATDPCLGGRCVNTEGSFSCLCETGFQPSPDSRECVGKNSRDWVGLSSTSAHLYPLSLATWNNEHSFSGSKAFSTGSKV